MKIKPHEKILFILFGVAALSCNKTEEISPTETKTLQSERALSKQMSSGKSVNPDSKVQSIFPAACKEPATLGANYVPFVTESLFSKIPVTGPGTVIYANDPKIVYSPNQQYSLNWGNGDLVLWKYTGGNKQLLWSSGTNDRGHYMAFQNDLNVVIYNINNVGLWDTKTQEFNCQNVKYRLGDAFLVVTNEGRAEVHFYNKAEHFYYLAAYTDTYGGKVDKSREFKIAYNTFVFH